MRVRSLPEGLPGEPRVIVLYSGGLDCSCICALLHHYLPPHEPIELVNVSFDGNNAPDRKAALEGYNELTSVYGSRKWHFIKVDVDEGDCIEVSERIDTLSRPNVSPLDKVSSVVSQLKIPLYFHFANLRFFLKFSLTRFL